MLIWKKKSVAVYLSNLWHKNPTDKDADTFLINISCFMPSSTCTCICIKMLYHKIHTELFFWNHSLNSQIWVKQFSYWRTYVINHCPSCTVDSELHLLTDKMLVQRVLYHHMIPESDLETGKLQMETCVCEYICGGK